MKETTKDRDIPDAIKEIFGDLRTPPKHQKDTEAEKKKAREWLRNRYLGIFIDK
jgi:hypothetical protein